MIVSKKGIKIILRIVLGFAVVFTILFICFFSFRDSFLNSILEKKIISFNKTYNAELKVEKANFKGFNGIEIKNISLKPIYGDTLFKIATTSFNVNVWKVIIGKVNLTNFELVDTYISTIKKDSLNNYMFLLHGKKNKDSIPINDTIATYSKTINHILELVFDKIPTTVHIKNFNILASINDYHFSGKIDDLLIENKKFSTFIKINENDKKIEWMVDGDVNSSDKTVFFKLYCPSGDSISIPYIKHKWNTSLTFDTIQFAISSNKYNDGILTIDGNGFVSNLMVKDVRISRADVVFDRMAINYKINIGTNYFELDSLSQVTFNKLVFNPYLKYLKDTTKQITLSLNKENFEAQSFFESLPKGLFYNLEGIETKGDLSYHFKFFVDLKYPDSLIFESDLKKHNFDILRFGNTNFTSMNQPFYHTAYENGQPVKTFMVGEENTDFRKLDQISKYLKDAILNTEDGAFYYHHGFIPEAFKKAIATNIKKGRFARGGSTISMQLIKNLYLNRNKTIARKIEEALIVWLIENNGLSTKARMYEVYLNIIEWGPMIYGVNEGARFYFSKDAEDLNLEESIFMASIIPKPKWFMYSFKEDGHLKDHLSDFYEFVSSKMLKKEMITQDEYDNLSVDVKLNGIAKDLLIKPDSGLIDTLQMFNELQDEL